MVHRLHIFASRARAWHCHSRIMLLPRSFQDVISYTHHIVVCLASMANLDEESEELHQKFLEKDIDLPTFVQKYKKLRTTYHKQALLHLAGQTSLR